MSNVNSFYVETDKITGRLDPAYYVIHPSMLGQTTTSTEYIVLGDLIESIYRYPTFYGINYVQEGTKIVKGENIRADGTIQAIDDFDYVDDITNHRFPKTMLSVNDLVFTVRGVVGKVGVVSEELLPANITGNCIKISLRDKRLSRFVAYYLNSAAGINEIARVTSGQVQKTITVDAIRKIPIPKIAPNALSKVYDLLDELDTQSSSAEYFLKTDLALIKALGVDLPMKATYKKWFTTASDEVNIRLDSSPYHPDRLNAINELKNGKYQLYPLKDVVDFQKTQVKNPSKSKPYLGLENIFPNTGTFVPSAQEKDTISSAFTFKSGDILFAKLRPYLNKVHLAQFEGICSTEFHVLRCSNKVLPQYLRSFLASALVVRQTSHLMTGNTLPRLQTEDIKGLLIPVPDLQTQQRIIEQILLIEDAAKQKSIAAAQQNKDILAKIENIITR